MKYIDADHLRAEIEKTYMLEIAPWLSGVSAKSAIYDYVMPIVDSLQQEQPEVDLEKEIDRMWNPRFNLGWDDNSLLSINHKSFEAIARHFYELGLNARKI